MTLMKSVEGYEKFWPRILYNKRYKCMEEYNLRG